MLIKTTSDMNDQIQETNYAESKATRSIFIVIFYENFLLTLKFKNNFLFSWKLYAYVHRLKIIFFISFFSD